MRILVIMHLFLPDRHGSAAAHSDLWMSLSACEDIEVTVRCPHPFEKKEREKMGVKPWRISRYDLGKVHLERYPVWFPTSSGSLLQRLLFEITYFSSLLSGLTRGAGFDAFVVYCPFASSLAHAALMKRVYRKPLWMHVLDVTADAAQAAGIVKAPILFRVFAWLERRLFNQADCWSTISEKMVRFLSTKRDRNQPIFLQANWVEPDLLKEIQCLPLAVPRNAGDPIKLLYVGSLGEKQNLLDFCKRLHESDLRFTFRIFCHGANACNLLNWVNGIEDERFFCGGFLDDKTYATELRKTDFFLITERQGSGAAYFPGKIVVSLAAGVPTLGVCDRDSALGEEISRYDVGRRFDWSDTGALLQLLKTIDDSRHQIKIWRKNALKRAEGFSRARSIAMFRDNLRQMVRSSGAPVESDGDGAHQNEVHEQAVPDKGGQ